MSNFITDSFYIIVLFALISILFAVEASTSLARVAGLSTGNLASGLQVQSGLSLLSRTLMAIFMPTLGAFSDSGKFSESSLSIIFFSTALIPTSIIIVYILRHYIIRIYQYTTTNLVKHGSYFPPGIASRNNFFEYNKKIIVKKIKLLRIVTFASYIPYYAAWPFIIYLLSIYPNDRGFIMGISSIMNGINTLALILYVDPLLIKLSKNKRVSINIYYDQNKIRLLAALFSSVPFLVVGVFI
jgi:hypothetical protein